MRIAIKVANSVRLRKLTELMKINGVSVYVHWSVLLIAALMLLNTPRRPVLTLVGLTAWLSVILIHECGHMIAAHRRRCAVSSIELYPIFGITCFQTPWSRFDHCVIAWGGVLAQALVGIPLAAWVAIVGYTPFEPVNAVLALLGFYSLGVAAFNLIPVAPLDGAIAWQIIPAFIERQRARRNRALSRYRSSR
jgi:stage IV sporulation protein FB